MFNLPVVSNFLKNYDTWVLRYFSALVFFISTVHADKLDLEVTPITPDFKSYLAKNFYNNVEGLSEKATKLHQLKGIAPPVLTLLVNPKLRCLPETSEPMGQLKALESYLPTFYQRHPWAKKIAETHKLSKLTPSPLFQSKSLTDYIILASREIKSTTTIPHYTSPEQVFAHQHLVFAWTLDFLYTHSSESSQDRQRIVALLSRPLLWGSMYQNTLHLATYQRITNSLYQNFYWRLMQTHLESLSLEHLANFTIPWSTQTHNMKPNSSDLDQANFLRWAIKTSRIPLYSEQRHRLLDELYELYLANENYQNAIGLLHHMSNREFDHPTFQLINKALFERLYPISSDFKTHYQTYQAQLKQHYLKLGKPNRPFPINKKNQKKRKK